MKHIYQAYIKEGKLIQKSVERARMDDDILNLREGDYIITIEKKRDKTSLNFIDWWWGVVIEMFYKYSDSGYEKQEWHKVLCDMYLPKKEIEIKNNGEILIKYINLGLSNDLNFDEIQGLKEGAQRLAAQEYNIEIPDPDPNLKRRWRQRK